MLTPIWAYIGYVYLALFLTAVLFCIKSKNKEMYWVAVVLGLLEIPAWGDTWGDPGLMAVAHFGILMVSLIIINAHMEKLVLSCLLAMVGADTLFYVAEFAAGSGINYQGDKLIFYWQSVLNIIFIYLCVSAIHGSSDKAIKAYEGSRKKNAQSNRYYYRASKSTKA